MLRGKVFVTLDVHSEDTLDNVVEECYKLDKDMKCKFLYMDIVN